MSIMNDDQKPAKRVRFALRDFHSTFRRSDPLEKTVSKKEKYSLWYTKEELKFLRREGRHLKVGLLRPYGLSVKKSVPLDDRGDIPHSVLRKLQRRFCIKCILRAQHKFDAAKLAELSRRCSQQAVATAYKKANSQLHRNVNPKKRPASFAVDEDNPNVRIRLVPV